MTPIVTLSVDPGAKSGVAVYRDGNTPLLETVGGSLESIRALVLEIYSPGTVQAIVTEGQWMATGVLGDDERGRTIHSVLSVVRCAAHWEGVAACYGFAVLPQMSPNTWQALLPKTPGVKRASLAPAFAQAKLGLPRLPTEDQAAAALIGAITHVERLIRLGGTVPPWLSWAALAAAKRQPSKKSTTNSQDREIAASRRRRRTKGAQP